jgi:hypothetical protein
MKVVAIVARVGGAGYVQYVAAPARPRGAATLWRGAEDSEAIPRIPSCVPSRRDGGVSGRVRSALVPPRWSEQRRGLARRIGGSWSCRGHARGFLGVCREWAL